MSPNQGFENHDHQYPHANMESNTMDDKNDKPIAAGPEQNDLSISEMMSVQQSDQQQQSVPLVALDLRNVTYSPLTKTSVSGSSLLGLRKQPAASYRTTVLHNISTKIVPHQVAAWMGPSGSGKTSLLSVAANLAGSDAQQALSPESEILVNGQEGQIPKRLVGVVWQDDLLLSNLSVRENVWYAARLKTPQSIPDVQVEELVAATLENLGLTKVQHSAVGNHLRRGISGGERKRVAVAIEHEPTSGLDATTALELMQTLKHLARSQGHSIVTVIHQPRTTIFNHYIDSLLLLSRGRVVYNGQPKHVRAYLETNCGGSVTPLPPETGIADWIMDVIKEDEQKQKQQQPNKKEDGFAASPRLADYWEQHVAKQKGQGSDVEESTDLTVFRDESGKTTNMGQPPQRSLSTLEELKAVPKYNSTFWLQFKLLTQRTMKQQRGERLTTTTATLQMAFLFFTALFWWRLPDTTRYIFERNSLFFFMLIGQSNGVVISAVTVFAMERTLLRRERAKKMYGVASYFLAKTVSDMTNNILLPLLYTMVVYWTANYTASVDAYFKYILSYYLLISTAQSMGLALSVAIRNVRMALVLAPPITLFFMIMGGFYIPFDNMHAGVEWVSYLSFCRYGYSSLIINEYAGRDIPCDGQDMDNSTSSDLNVRAGLAITACPLPGEDVVSSFGIDGVTEGFWFNIGMMVILQVVFRFVAYWILRQSK